MFGEDYQDRFTPNPFRDSVKFQTCPITQQITHDLAQRSLTTISYLENHPVESDQF